MNRGLEHLPTGARSLLLAYQGALGRRHLVTAFCAALSVALGVLLIVANAERWFPRDLETTVRWLSFALILAGAVATLMVLLLLGRSKRGNLLHLSHEAERGLASSEENLPSAMELFHPGRRPENDSVMLAMLEARTEHLAKSGPVPLAPARVRNACLLGGAVLLLTHLALLALPNYQYTTMVARVLMPWAAIERPAFTRIEIAPTPHVLPRGEDLPVQVGMHGRLPDRAFIEWSEDPESDGSWQTSALQRIGRDAFLHFFVGVPESFAFRIRAGDHLTQARHVKVVDRPRIAEARLRIQWPDYTGRPEQVLSGEELLEARVVRGGTVQLEVLPSDNAETVGIPVWTETETIETQPETSEEGLVSIQLSELQTSLSWTVELTDAHGFENLDREQMRVLVFDDARPNVRLGAPDFRMTVYPSEEVPLRIEADDDFGLQRVVLAYRLNPDPDLPQPPERIVIHESEDEAALLTWEGTRDLRPVDLGAGPGDIIEIEAEAMDSRNQFGKSPTLILEVVAFDPGRDERRRIENLRMLQAWAGGISQVDPEERQPAGGRVPPGIAEEVRVIAERARVQALPLIDDGAHAIFERVLEEIRLTPYPLYRSDLRSWVEQTGLALLAGTSARADAVLDRWASEDLQAQIHYRAVHNLMFAVRVLRTEMTSMAEKSNRSGLEDFRETAGNWFIEASRVLRETGIPAGDGADNAAFFRDLNARLFALDPTQQTTVVRFDDALGELERVTAAALPDLAERLVAVRQERRQADDLYEAVVAANSEDPSPELIQWAEILLRSHLDDPSVAPAEALPLFFLYQAWLNPDRFGRNLAAAERFRRSPPAALAAHRDRVTEQALFSYRSLRLSPSGGGLGEHDLPLEDQWLRRQETRDALVFPPEFEEEPIAAKDFPAFEQNPQARLRADLESFADAAIAWGSQTEEIRSLLTQRVPQNTLSLREPMLAAEEATLRAADILRLRLRMMLRLGLEDTIAAVLDPREAIALLLAIEFREAAFHSRAAESSAVFHRFREEELSAEELDLFATRINLYRGASAAMVRLAGGLREILDNPDAARGFLADEATRIALSGELYTAFDELRRLQTTQKAEGLSLPADRARVNHALADWLNRRDSVLEDPETLNVWRGVLLGDDPPVPPSNLEDAVAAPLRNRHSARRMAVDWRAVVHTHLQNEQPEAAEFALRLAIANLLAPSVTADLSAVYRGGRGTEPERPRLWLVDELQESERMPAPTRFSGEVREYFDNLRRSFRQYPHTR